MSSPNYQAFGFKSEKDIFAVLDLKMSKIITAAVILFMVPTSFLAYFIGDFGSGIAFLLLFLYFMKSSAQTFLIYKNQTKELIIFVMDGFVPHKKIIEISSIEKFVIDKAKNKYRIAIILKNGKAIVPVPSYTNRLYLASLHKTINLFSDSIELSQETTQIKETSTKNYESQNHTQEEVRQAKKQAHQYVPAKHWHKQTNKTAIKYIHRPSLQAVTRLSKTNKNPITIFIVIIAIIGLALFFAST